MRGILYGAFAALLSTTAMANESANGTWKTESSEDGGYLEVTIAACESDVTETCGTISKAHNGKGLNEDYEHLGKLMVKSMQPEGESSFSGGTIWDPEADKTYKSKMQVNGDILKVDGCIAFFCSGQNWARVK